MVGTWWWDLEVELGGGGLGGGTSGGGPVVVD